MSIKPLGRKGYGHIPHLPQSRMGPGDHKLHEGQEKICVKECRDHHDEIIVTEKLDGSNVCVAKVDGQIMPITRAGYHCKDSPHRQHHMFAEWVYERQAWFDKMLCHEQRLVGEWMAMAHGTMYKLWHQPFVAFDLMTESRRLYWDHFHSICFHYGIQTPKIIHRGGPISVDAVMKRLGKKGFHGALERVEGAVWRVERKGEFDFMAKYVRPDKIDGCYIFDSEGNQLSEMSWNILKD